MLNNPEECERHIMSETDSGSGSVENKPRLTSTASYHASNGQILSTCCSVALPKKHKNI